MSDKQVKPKSSMSAWQIFFMAVLGLAILLGAAFVFTPVVMTANKKSPATEATNNAKQIFYLLVEFDGDFGEFPSDATAMDNWAEFKGEYSNDYFGQFFIGKYTQSEEIFFTSGEGSNKPDNKVTSKKEILAEGECGFAYIKGLATHDLKGKPIVMAPMYGDGFKFNPHPFDNKCVVLRIDGAVKQLRLNNEHHAILEGKQTLFSGGKKSVWGEAGFDEKDLCYAKYPYKLHRRLSPLVFLAICIALPILYYILKRIRAASAKQQGS